jgi:hypothetical protein
MHLVEETEVGVKDHLFRLRRLESNRTARYRGTAMPIVQGSITEYRNTSQDPLVHKAGDAIPGNHLVSHWWKNTGKQTAIVLSADLFHVADPNSHMM